MSNFSEEMSSILKGSTGNGDEPVDLPSVFPTASVPLLPPVPVKKMRGAIRSGGESPIGRYHSRPKIAASKPSRSPRTIKKQKTGADDSNDLAIVVYKPRSFPFNLSGNIPGGNVPQGERTKFPKPSAVRQRVEGMRIRGCTDSPGSKIRRGKSAADSRKKQKHQRVTSASDSESEREVTGIDPFPGEAGSSVQFESSTSKSGQTSSKQVTKRNKIDTTNSEEPEYESNDPRDRVKQVTRMFDNLRRRFLLEEESRNKNTEKGGGPRADIKAYNLLKEKNYRVNGQNSIVGEVPGILVGDHFYYRIELYLIALHCQTQAGIDYIPAKKSTYHDSQGNALAVAVSVIASGGYEDDKDEGNILIYTGQGGNNYKGYKSQGTDQVLTKGNLGLKNSCDLHLPVRVIRGNDVKKGGVTSSPSGKIYYYDGLYDVTEFYQEVGASGNKVWKYKLTRREGQRELMSELVSFKKGAKVAAAQGSKVLLEDISNGQESLKVRVVGSEGDELPPSFLYIVKNEYPRSIALRPVTSCSCLKECWDSCPCLKWNRGQPPYNESGSLVIGKRAIYECGPECSCRSECCYNRVSQKGLRFDLEVFKTGGKGWGVRSRCFIPQGSFICEYVGEVIPNSEAELRVSTDDYLFDLKVPRSQEKRLGDVSGLVEDPIDSLDESEEDDPECERWTLDARERGNVARFINHSCNGNLFVQCVFYEHHDERFPHIMLFAMEKISPYKELTYDYGYVVNSVKANGKQKMKECLCGATKCRGRLY